MQVGLFSSVIPNCRTKQRMYRDNQHLKQALSLPTPQICSTLTNSEARVLFYQNILMLSHELCIQILTFHYWQCDFHAWSHKNLK